MHIRSWNQIIREKDWPSFFDGTEKKNCVILATWSNTKHETRTKEVAGNMSSLIMEIFRDDVMKLYS